MRCDESSDDELLLLAEKGDAEDERQKAAARRRARHLAFNSSLAESTVWKVNFRFTREQVDVLTRLLRLLDTFRTSSRHTASGTQALCILLRRLAYPSSLSDMQQFFSRDEIVISIIGNGVLGHVYSKFTHLLDFDCFRLTPLKLQAFTDAVNQ